MNVRAFAFSSLLSGSLNSALVSGFLRPLSLRPGRLSLSSPGLSLAGPELGGLGTALGMLRILDAGRRGGNEPWLWVPGDPALRPASPCIQLLRAVSGALCVVLKGLVNQASVSPYDGELTQICSTRAMIGRLLCTSLLRHPWSYIPCDPGREAQGVFVESSSVGGKGGEVQTVTPIISRSFGALCHLPDLKVWRSGLRELK